MFGSDAPPGMPIWLHVQTITAPEPFAQPTSGCTSISTALLTSIHDTLPDKQLSNLGSLAKTGKRKLKSVHFDPSVDIDKEQVKSCKARALQSISTLDNQQSQSFVTFDLKATDSICDHLSQSCQSAATCADSCLGYLEYLEATLSSRLIFYDASKNAVASKNRPTANGKAMPVNKALQNLRTLHQLTLAHQLAVATLQYHSTSWLAQDWGLKDISYFDTTTQATSDQLLEQLQSLHLSTQFPSAASSDGGPNLSDQEDIKYYYGIRNLPLAKLGVALLEIGCQTAINILDPASTPHDVISARKLLRDPPQSIDHLGERYLKIAQKCIDCDFSCGDDLSSDDLRSAVYTEVICGLEGLVLDWKKFVGIK